MCDFCQVLDKVTPQFAAQQLPQFHQGFSGLSEGQAELQFLKEAQKLQEYGLHFYKVHTVSSFDCFFVNIVKPGNL